MCTHQGLINALRLMYTDPLAFLFCVEYDEHDESFGRFPLI